MLIPLRYSFSNSSLLGSASTPSKSAHTVVSCALHAEKLILAGKSSSASKNESLTYSEPLRRMS
uniref:Uncharacterized protein n=1 Tax=Siphoviridae sp. ct1TR2 TaxID=2825309 RepID=A0A8S5NUA4_9CAUD|nr:MAG TPA: hypothetical protein [Siphoviridae sp. ct1TR2]